MADPMTTALAAMRDVGIEFVRRYNRLSITGTDLPLDGPVLFVANHGFGGIFDLNVFAALAAFQDLGVDGDVTVLTHHTAWQFKIGRFVEPLGARPASRESALDAFAARRHVLVLPGGDLDAFKPWADRNRIVFGGRRGFVRLALDSDVPIVPIVTAGGAESVISLPGGRTLARALRLDQTMRAKAMPIALALPYGLSVGAAGFLPYLPLPAKLQTAVLPPMTPAEDEDASAFGDRVERVMQAKLTELTKDRIPFLG